MPGMIPHAAMQGMMVTPQAMMAAQMMSGLPGLPAMQGIPMGYLPQGARSCSLPCPLHRLQHTAYTSGWPATCCLAPFLVLVDCLSRAQHMDESHLLPLISPCCMHPASIPLPYLHSARLGLGRALLWPCLI